MDNLKRIIAAALLVLSLTLGYSWANAEFSTSAAVSAASSQGSGGEVTINTAAPPSVTDRPGAGEPTPTPTPTPEP